MNALVDHHARPVDALAERVETTRDPWLTVQVLALQAMVHERLADLIEVAADHAMADALRASGERCAVLHARAETIIARLEARLQAARASSFRGAGVGTTLNLLEQQVRALRAALDDEGHQNHPSGCATPDERCDIQVGAMWIEEALAHRLLAVRGYATAARLARTRFVTSPEAAPAAQRLQDERNRPWLERGIDHATRDEFDAPVPGAVLLEVAMIHGAPLAR